MPSHDPADLRQSALARVLSLLTADTSPAHDEAWWDRAVDRFDVFFHRSWVSIGPSRWWPGNGLQPRDRGPKAITIPWLHRDPTDALRSLALEGLVPPAWADKYSSPGWVNDLGESEDGPREHRDLVSVACLGRKSLDRIESAAAALAGADRRSSIKWAIDTGHLMANGYCTDPPEPTHPDASPIWRSARSIADTGATLLDVRSGLCPMWRSTMAQKQVTVARISVACVSELTTLASPRRIALRLVRDVAAYAARGLAEEGLRRAVGSVYCEDEPLRSRLRMALIEEVPEFEELLAQEDSRRS